MQKCQHGKAIVKFCLFEHCQSRETGGCDDCVKKYHNHIGQISFLNEDDIKNIIKRFQVQSHYRPKSRSLQQGIFNFFTHIKTSLSQNFDIVCKSLINQIGYPYLQKNGTLSCYKRLKNKEYRKVSQKELKELWEIFKTTEHNQILKAEKKIYAEAVNSMEHTLQKIQKNIKDVFQHLNAMVLQTKTNFSSYDRAHYLKINEIFRELKKYPNIGQAKKSQNVEQRKPSIKNEEISNEKKKINRDVSLDKHVRFENNLKKQKQQSHQSHINDKIENDKKLPQQRKEQNREKLNGQKKIAKYSIDLKPEDVVLKSPQKIDQNENKFSQKQEQILQRKRKLMQLMNSKPKTKKQQPQTQKLKQSPKKGQLGDFLTQNLSPHKLLAKNDFVTKSVATTEKNESHVNRKSSRSDPIQSASKRSKKTEEQQEQRAVQYKKQINNYGEVVSQTETQQLFKAKIHIPIQDNKCDDQFQINQQSVHKFIVVPEVDIIAKGMLDIHVKEQCQSPLLKKKLEIESFCAFIKLAESKILNEDQKETPKAQTPTKEENQNFLKMVEVTEYQTIKQPRQIKSDNPVNESNKNNQLQPAELQQKLDEKQKESVCVYDNEQFSLALLLKSLKLPTSEAIKYLEKSIQYSHNNLSAAEYLSYLYLQAERPQDCLKLCNDILKLISSSETNLLAIRLNINKSAALNFLGRYSECITFLERCLRQNHNDILYKNLADAYYSIGILEKAIYNYQHAIIENSSNTEAHYNLAVCHYQQENYYNASIYIEKALKHQPTNQIYMQMKKHTEEKILMNQIKQF